MASFNFQLERLQAENASEWGKRERLETEKLSIERENKKLRAELNDVIERLERKGRPQPTADNELRTLQQELCDKSKVGIFCPHPMFNVVYEQYLSLHLKLKNLSPSNEKKESQCLKTKN